MHSETLLFGVDFEAACATVRALDGCCLISNGPTEATRKGVSGTPIRLASFGHRADGSLALVFLVVEGRQRISGERVAGLTLLFQFDKFGKTRSVSRS
jgi:hypothetical protein